MNLETWTNYLNHTTPSGNKPHSWICEVRGGFFAPRTYKVLTAEEYQKTSYCRKLSFNEIVSISNNFLNEASGHNPFFSLRSQARLDLSNLIMITSTFEGDVEARILKRIDEVGALADNFKPLETALSVMYSRGRKKHLAEKTASCWGWVKYQIWSWFYDQLNPVAKILHGIPTLSSSLEGAKDSVKSRIYINITSYEDQLRLDPEERVDYNNRWDREFDTPHKVRQNWLSIYHPDKCKGGLINEEEARTDFGRIVVLLKIWDQINKYEKRPVASPIEETSKFLELNLK